MNLGPGSSAILDLKAELLRKRNQNENRTTEKVQPFTVRKGGFKIERREAKKPRELDAPPPEDDLEEEALRASRRKLEEKARLYDERVNEVYTEETEDDVLDFNRKRAFEKQRKRKEHEEENTAQYEDNDDDSDWTTFVDSLGRTRKCLKTDLGHYKNEDSKMRRELDLERSGEGDRDEQQNSVLDETQSYDLNGIPLPQQGGASEEALAKQEREKRWNQIEEENNAKEHIHYRDVLFDEIREHGQAHFEFSRDDTERAHQIKILEKLREDSTNAQKASQAIKRRREEILKERMKRVRERKGLPPEREEEKPKEIDIPLPPPPPLPKEIPSTSHIRPWDEGKEVHGVPIRRAPPRSYVEERRSERPSEFAPPSLYEQRGWKKSTQPKTSDVDDFLEDIKHKF